MRQYNRFHTHYQLTVTRGVLSTPPQRTTSLMKMPIHLVPSLNDSVSPSQPPCVEESDPVIEEAENVLHLRKKTYIGYVSNQQRSAWTWQSFYRSISRMATVTFRRMLHWRHELKQIGNKRKMVMRMILRFWLTEREEPSLTWAIAVISRKEIRSLLIGVYILRKHSVLLETVSHRGLAVRNNSCRYVVRTSAYAPFTMNEFACLFGILFTVEECTRCSLSLMLVAACH